MVMTDNTTNLIGLVLLVAVYIIQRNKYCNIK